MFNNIRHLRYLVTVAQSGSLTAAARDLMVSESAVSAAIKACEEELGYSVFIRQPARPLELTPTGADFVRLATSFLDQAEAFHEGSVGLGAMARGTVRLGAFAAFSSVVLPPVMQLCAARHPALRLQIAEHDLAELLKRLRNGEVDLAITYDLQLDNDVVFEDLYPVQPHIGVGPGHRLAERREVGLAELEQDPMVLIDYPVTKQHILRLFHDRGVLPNVAYYPRTMEMLHALVLHGFGYSMFFMRPPEPWHPGSAIHRIAIEDPPPGHNVVMAYPRHIRLAAKVQAVVDLCREALNRAQPGSQR